MINLEKEESAGNLSLDFSSGTYFLLLRTHDGGIDGLDVSINFIVMFLFFFPILIPILRGIVITF